MIKIYILLFIFISYIFTLYTRKTHNQSLFSHTFKIPLHLHIQSSIFFLVFQNMVSLCSSGCPGIRSTDQDGLNLRNLPASASQLMGLQVCATTPGLQGSIFLKKYFWQMCAHIHTLTQHITCYLIIIFLACFSMGH